MSGRNRCDEILRIIDEALGEDAAAHRAAPVPKSAATKPGATHPPVDG